MVNYLAESYSGLLLLFFRYRSKYYTRSSSLILAVYKYNTDTVNHFLLRLEKKRQKNPTDPPTDRELLKKRERVTIGKSRELSFTKLLLLLLVVAVVIVVALIYVHTRTHTRNRSRRRRHLNWIIIHSSCLVQAGI